MPIDRDDFEADGPVREPTTSELALQFLLAHADRAFTRAEIAEATGASAETVGTNLTRLKNRGLVQHREPYWAITADRGAVIEALEERGGGASPMRLAALAMSNRQNDLPGTHHQQASRAFVERARNRFDDVFAGLYLFGSVARETETESSDIDILAVIADSADYQAVDDGLLDIAYDVQLEYGVPVEVHVVPAAEFAARRDRGEPFVRTVLAEGTAIA